MAKKRSARRATTRRNASSHARSKKTVAKITVVNRAAAKKTVTTKAKTVVRKTTVKTAAKKTAIVRLAAPLGIVGRAAGFDTGSYPGDAAIKAWAANSPFEFVGFYFDAPCHTTASFKTWSGKFAFIRSTGLGLAVVYVGFQQDGCGKDKVSRANGILHGQDTIAKFTTEGFASGTIVFLDVENFSGALSADMEAYVRGWISVLLDDGTVGPGIYCPASKANALHLAAQKEYAAHGLPSGAPAFWIVKATDPLFDPAKSNPADCGVSFANIWQGLIDTTEKHGGVTIDIDQNVADSNNPSRA
jgi:hypothetical protein